MAGTVNLCVRVDDDSKKNAEAIYRELGLSLSSAINIFLRQSVRVGGLPFDLCLEVPNDTTIEAMLEAKRLLADTNARLYDSMDDIRTELER